MTEVEDYIYTYEGGQRKLLIYLHEWLTQKVNMIDKLKYQIAFYYQKSWICYLNPSKTGGVEFAFVRGNELSNQNALLESKGRKQVYSVTYEQVTDVALDLLNEVMQEAILLDSTVPYAAKRRR